MAELHTFLCYFVILLLFLHKVLIKKTFIMGKGKGKGQGKGAAGNATFHLCMYFIGWLLLAFIATVACISPFIYKGVTCDFNANAFLVCFGILYWFICLIVVLAVTLNSFQIQDCQRFWFCGRLIDLKWIVVALPFLLNFGFSVWGTVVMTMSKTCAKSAASGPKFFEIGSLCKSLF